MIFPSTLAYLFFNRGIALIGPNRAAPFFHLVPVFGSAMAILLLGEQPRLFHLVGYVLVLAGVVIASRRGSATGVPDAVQRASGAAQSGRAPDKMGLRLAAHHAASAAAALRPGDRHPPASAFTPGKLACPPTRQKTIRGNDLMIAF